MTRYAVFFNGALMCHVDLPDSTTLFSVEDEIFKAGRGDIFRHRQIYRTRFEPGTAVYFWVKDYDKGLMDLMRKHFPEDFE